MKKILIYTLVLVCFFAFVSNFALASTAQEIAKQGLATTNAQAKLSEGDPATTIGAMLSVLLSILGLVFVIICVYAGITWMTAAGDADNVKKARSMLIQGALGLAVTLAAYALTSFVVDRIGGAVAG